MRTTGRTGWTGISKIIARGMAIGWLAGCGSSVSAPHSSPIQSVSELRDPAPRPGEPAALAPDAVSSREGATAAREYWASESGGTLQAPNRMQNLRTVFEPKGVQLHDGTAAGSPKLVDLTLSGLGRGKSLSPVPSGELSHAEARVEIAREALGLVEWFENTDEGLEQGLTLNERPTSADVGPTQAPLVVELSVKGATATRSGDSVVLATQAGRSLEYGHLAVVDVRGVALASHFEVPSADRIRLVVDDAAATYPIVIDPLLTRLFDTRLESNQIDGHLGQSVASAGDVNGDGYEDMISAKGNGFGPPVVYIHHGGPNGIASGAAAGAPATVLTLTQFGEVRVASAGDVNGDGYDDVLVGSYSYNAGQGVFEGAAFVYRGGPSGVASGNELTASARLEGDQASGFFGNSVASAGDVNGDGYADVIVGAPVYDNGQTDEGAAFVFLGSATGIANGSPATAHARLESNQAVAQMGGTVASAGDVNGDGKSDVIVGAGLYDDGQLDEGAAFVFLGSASGIANGNPTTAHARLESDTDSGGSYAYGVYVAGLGDVNGDGYGDVGLGLPAYAGQKGAAFVFKGSPTGLVANGSPANATTSLVNPTPGDPFFPGNFGSSLAAGDLNGDGYADLLVGAWTYSLGQAGEGAVFVYYGGSTGIANGGPATAQVTLDSNQAGTITAEEILPTGLGWTIGVGDTNGDGFGDPIAGLQNYTIDQSHEGAVLVYRGGSRQFERMASESTDLSVAGLTSPNDVAGFGNIGLVPLTRAAGDVNGDGFGDVILGAFSYDNAGAVDSGIALVFHGSELGISGNEVTAKTVLQQSPPQALGLYGSVVSTAGDVNGDGYADVLVAGQVGGSAYLHLGSPTGVPSGGPTTADARFDVTQPGSAPISSLASAGDVNGDGYGDIVIGVDLYDSGEVDEGAAFLFLGGPTVGNGNASNAHARFEGNQANARFGQFVSSAGDVNGDGFDDLLVSAPGTSSGQVSEGAAFLFLGSASGIPSGSPATAHVRFESDQANTSAPLPIAVSAGDVNGDGFGDVAFGVGAYHTSVQFGGTVFVFHGSAAGIANGHAAAANATVSSSIAQEGLGSFVTSLGDLDGDGFDELAVQGQDFLESYVLGGSALGVATGEASLVARRTWPTGLSGPADHADVNGDGFPDALFRHYELRTSPDPQFQEALAVVHPSNSIGRSTLVKQRRNDPPTTLVSPGGTVVASSGFTAELSARSPRGRERAKLEVELCPVPVAFGNAACTKQRTSTWVDLGTTGAGLSTSLTNLAVNTRYAWRARTLFAASSANQPGIAPRGRPGPWFRPTQRTGAEDFRTIVPEPTGAGGLLLGTSLLRALARRRGANRDAMRDA